MKRRLTEFERVDKLKRGKKPTGRPLQYGGDVWEELLERLADGETVTAICRDSHMPSRREVTRKASKDTDFRLAYARARLDSADAVFDGLIELITNFNLKGSNAEASRLKTLVDTQKWILSHVNPRKYADKIGFDPDEGEKPVKIIICGPEDEDED